jgi:iron complex transport system substrate-binding protein
VISLQPNGLEDIFTDLDKVARALGLEPAGARLCRLMRERMEAVSARAAGAPRRTVALIEWIDPLMAAGNWMPTLAELAGGVVVGGGEAGKHSPFTSFEALRAADPEVIVILPCGFDLARTRAELAPLTGHEGWAALRAVRGGRAFIADGNQYFNRPGPRVVESLEIMAELLHPELFQVRHRGSGWEPV